MPFCDLHVCSLRCNTTNSTDRHFPETRILVRLITRTFQNIHLIKMTEEQVKGKRARGRSLTRKMDIIGKVTQLTRINNASHCQIVNEVYEVVRSAVLKRVENAQELQGRSAIDKTTTTLIRISYYAEDAQLKGSMIESLTLSWLS